MHNTADVVAVIGTGLLGRGIAAVAARAGHPVVIHDSVTRALDDALAHVKTYAGPQANARVASTLDDAVAGATLVVECVVEDLAIKQAMFVRMGEVAPDAILMSNSSSLPISDIGCRTSRPERTVGAHWFNPPQLIPMVEVIRGRHTSEETMARATAFLHAIGKTTVRVDRDVPGFVGNRLQHALWREAMALLSDGVISARQLDCTIAATVGQRLRVCGPLEEIDRMGAAAALVEFRQILPLINQAPEPAALLKQKVANSELGSKTGRGFLVWNAGDRERAAATLNAHVERCVSEGRIHAELGPFAAGLDEPTHLIARRLRMALWREAVALVSDGICDAATVDLMACNTFGLRLEQMGPIETADFVGLDLALAVHARIFPSFVPSTVPPPLLVAMAREGTTFIKPQAPP
jgi:3-hydroxybutyryl-CoA dehydrogenase